MLLPLLLTLVTHALPNCDVTLVADGNTAAIQTALDRTDRPVICLRPGKFVGARFVISQSATLRRLGDGEVLLDADGRGRVFTLPTAGVRLALAGLTLTGGNAQRGGAIEVSADATLLLTDCQIRDNTATRHGGGGLWASAGDISAVRTRWLHNMAETGAAIALSGTAKLRLVANLVMLHPAQTTDGAPIQLTGAARMALRSSTVAYNAGPCIAMAANLQENPRLLVADSVLLGAPDGLNVPRWQAEHVEVLRSVVSGRVGFVALDLASRRDAPQLDALGPERAMPGLGSPAIDLGRCDTPEQKTDLLGQRRSKRCTAGALEPSPQVTAHTRWLRKHRP